MGTPSHDGCQAGAGHIGDLTHGCENLAMGARASASSMAVKRAVTRGWPEAMAMSQDSSRVTERAAASTSSGARPGASVVTVMMVR